MPDRDPLEKMYQRHTVFGWFIVLWATMMLLGGFIDVLFFNH